MWNKKLIIDRYNKFVQNNKIILTIDTIPIHSRGENVRGLITPDTWNRIRTKIYKNAKYTCEICGMHNVEMHCHEHFEYCFYRCIQKLVKLQCLCVMCHSVKHMNYAPILNISTTNTGSKYYVVTSNANAKHWIKVNNSNVQIFLKYLNVLNDYDTLKNSEVFNVTNLWNIINTYGQ